MPFDEKPFSDNEHLLYAHIALTNLMMAHLKSDLARIVEMLGSSNIAYRSTADDLVTKLKASVKETEAQWEPIWEKYESRLNEEPPAATENS